MPEPKPRTAALFFFLATTVSLGIVSVSLMTYMLVTSPVPQEPHSPIVEHHKTHLNCTVLIIGSGFAGSYAAYQLAPQLKETLCLVERLDRDGGRIHDVSEYPGGPVFGAGGLRVTREQTTMRALAEELGIELQEVVGDEELMKVRGQYFYRGATSEADRMCRELFPTMNCNAGNDSSVDELMYAKLHKLYKEDPEFIHSFTDFPTLLLTLFGAEGLAFIRENGYHSLFTSVASHAVLDFLATDGWGPLSYPVGGMSQYIQRMLNRATENGMRIFHGEPVFNMTVDDEGHFLVETETLYVAATKVLCSIDPTGFRNVSGNVGDAVRSSLEFRGVAPKPSVTVAAWWNDRWWEGSSLHGARNLTRVTSHGDCFNGMEIATYPYGRNQNVTRVVYDDGACVHTWRTLIAAGDSEQLTTEVLRSLQQVFHDVQVPRPRTVYGMIHENAWHFQDPSSTKTNRDVFQWSLKPTSHENFALIGEAYNLNFSGWCDAALKSTMTVLTRHYNFTYPCLHDHGSPAVCPSDAARRSSLPRSTHARMP